MPFFAVPANTTHARTDVSGAGVNRTVKTPGATSAFGKGSDVTAVVASTLKTGKFDDGVSLIVTVATACSGSMMYGIESGLVGGSEILATTVSDGSVSESALASTSISTEACPAGISTRGGSVT